jgi:hypothetical protein
MYSGCVLDQITWQMQRSGLLTATARLVAQGKTVGTTTSAGTPAALELKRFGHFNGAITRNGTALGNVVSAEITYANNLDRIETIRSDGRIDGTDPSIAALTGRIEVRFADQTLVTQVINGETCEMEFAYVPPSGESLTFTVHAVYLPRPRIEISGPQGVQATFDWQAARDSVVSRICTVTFVNDVGFQALIFSIRVTPGSPSKCASQVRSFEPCARAVAKMIASAVASLCSRQASAAASAISVSSGTTRQTCVNAIT